MSAFGGKADMGEIARRRFATGLGGLGLLGWRRKRTQATSTRGRELYNHLAATVT
jgi:hypothetical protein